MTDDPLPDDYVELKAEQKRLSQKHSHLSVLGWFMFFGCIFSVAALYLLEGLGAPVTPALRYILFGLVGVMICCLLYIIGFALLHPDARRIRRINRKLQSMNDY